jgi:hypothetical protein
LRRWAYISFETIPNGKKKSFFVDIAFQEDANRVEKELFDLFWSQHAMLRGNCGVNENP